MKTRQLVGFSPKFLASIQNSLLFLSIFVENNLKFKVFVSFEDNKYEATDNDLELSAVNDVSEDYLSKEKTDYLNPIKQPQPQ